MKILIAVDIEGISGGANGRRAPPHDQRLRVRARERERRGNG
jgi:D-aminopeptidase